MMNTTTNKARIAKKVDNSANIRLLGRTQPSPNDKLLAIAAVAGQHVPNKMVNQALCRSGVDYDDDYSCLYCAQDAQDIVLRMLTLFGSRTPLGESPLSGCRWEVLREPVKNVLADVVR